MYEFFQTHGSWIVLVFVLSSMLNVGLTQKPTELWKHLSINRSFLRRMLLLNFVVVPSIMIAIVQLVDLDPVYETGLLIFGLCAGAVFLIRLANISLYALMISIVIGYLPALAEFQVWKPMMVGTYVLLLSLFLGWAMGDGHGNLKDVGALGTAQRGVAPAMIVAQGNFDDPGVLMIITLVNLAGVIALIIAAKTFSRDNTIHFIEPVPIQIPKRAKV